MDALNIIGLDLGMGALKLLHAFLKQELQWFALAFDLTWGNTTPFTMDLPTLASITKLSVKEIGGAA